MLKTIYSGRIRFGLTQDCGSTANRAGCVTPNGAMSVGPGYVGSVLRLALLAPDIVEAILNGQAAELKSAAAARTAFSGVECSTGRDARSSANCGGPGRLDRFREE
jgi:hypothetical protein